MKTKAQKWGNSLAVRIPHGIAEEIGLKPNAALTIEVRKGRIVLVPTKEGGAIPRYRLDDLLKGAKRRVRHAEIDFGPRTGNEMW